MSAHTLNASSHRSWVIAVVTVLAAACSSSPPSPSPSTSPGPSESPAPLFPEPSLSADASAWDRLMARVGAAGQPDRQAALDAFAIAFSPLPGTQAPAGAVEDVPDGTLAVHWIRQFWDTLTADQQAYAGSLINGEVPQAVADQLPIAAAGLFPLARPAPPAALPNDWKSLAEQMREEVGARLGRELEAQMVIKPLSLIDVPKDLWHNPGWEDPTDANGGWTGKMATCTISIHPDSFSYGPDDAKELMAHEVFHCFDDDLGNIADYAKVPPWVTEGAAEWAGFSVSEGKGSGVYNEWAEWLIDPGRPLYSRSYDAFAIYYLLQDAGVDTWKNIDDVLKAARGGTEPAYNVLSGMGDEPFLDTWGSRYFNYPDASHQKWRYIGDGSAAVKGMFSDVPEVPITAGDTYSQSADPYAAGDVLARFESDVLVLDSDGGHGQVATHWDDMPLEDAVTRPFCTLPQGCSCPSGSVGSGTQFWQVPFDSVMAMGITGHVTGVRITLLGLNLDDLCERPPTGGSSKTACVDGCPGSNGDPHLITIDDRFYDFQAAGEFTLLRSADDSFRIQARQEPWQGSHSVSINTAVAIGLDSDRAALYVGTTGTRLLVNGQEVSMTDTRAAGALAIRPIPNGLEFDAPDGTIVWVMGLGRWGLNVMLAPSDELRATGTGLLGPVGEQGQLPALPDGSAVQIGGDYRSALYEVLASGWEVTAGNSLFDYEAGQGPATFRDQSLPEPGAPLDFTALSSEQQTAGLQACAAIIDPTFKKQCAFDVAVTADQGFVTSYQQTEAQLGPQAQVPEATPSVPPAQDACAVLTDDQILQITGYPVVDKVPGINHSGDYSAGCFWSLDAGRLDWTHDLYLNVLAPGGRASFDEYLVSWPDLDHVPNLGDDAVLDVGNSSVAVKGDTRVDVQYVNVNVTAQEAERVLIELVRAALAHY